MLPSPSSMLAALLGILLVSVAVILTAIVLPDHYLVSLEGVTAKRILICILATNFAFVCFLVYHTLFLPYPPRVVLIVLWVIMPIFGSIASLNAIIRPDYFKLTQSPTGGLPDVEMKYAGYDPWATVVVGLFLFFLWANRNTYSDHYYRHLQHSKPATGPSRYMGS
jgi:hypothetical protein